ncbi:MAG: hypothetical protein AAGN82_10330 [Myxococcota bacterium]
MHLRELAARITSRPGRVRLVAIDGPGGSGKSTFAAALADVLDAPVVPTDAFASSHNPIDWWPRLLEQVIEPLAAGRAARYQRYNWGMESLAEWIEVAPVPVVIIEGVTAGRVEWRQQLSTLIWVETPAAERLRRGLERDGEDALADWERWGAEEVRHYAEDPTRRHADVVVDGTVPLVDGAFATL